MRIAVLSPNPNHLRDIGSALGAGAHTVVLVEGGSSRTREVAEQEQPDLMLVDGMCRNPGELAHVEHLTTSYPAMAVVLLCSTHSPEFLLHAMRAGVREVLPSPPGAGTLDAAVARIAAKRAGAKAPTQGKVVAFLPCKGGSGATFLATNLGYQLAEHRSVLLVDLNLQCGDALSYVHDGKPATTLADVARDISRLDASLLASSTVRITPTLSILAAPEDLAQSMEVKPEHIDAILAVAATQYDFVLLDVSRTLDTIGIKALDRAERIYAVMQSSLPHVRNAARLMEVFRSLGYQPDKIQMIVNRYEKTAEIGLEQIQRSMGEVKLLTVPNSFREINAAINHGDPLARASRGNAVARRLADLAATLSPQQEDTRGLLGRLFRRA